MSTRFTWCWFALVLILALGFVGGSAFVRARALDRLSAAPAGIDPPLTGRNRLYPSSAYDGLFWISYAQEMAAEGAWRVRQTDIDNAPYGREVHWSSGFAWWLVALGHARHAFTAEPLPQAIEYAAAYANPLLLMLALPLIGCVGARRYGPAVGLVLVAASVSLPLVIDSFAVNEPDHHGLINLAAFGTVFGLIAGGLGRESRDADKPYELWPAAGRARSWFLLSAVCGAAGLWISAATQILVLLGVALGAIAALFVAGAETDASRDRIVSRPELWRLWGRWGAGLSLGFYVLEYFPSHLAMRLEVNHPLYAVAWWGAGELLAALTARRRTGEPLWPREGRGQLARAAALLALLAPASAIFFGGAAWFRMLDPVFGVLPSLVIEGQSLLENLRRVSDSSVFVRDLAALGALGLLGCSAVVARSATRPERALALGAGLMVFPLLVAAWFQNRWLIVVSGVAPVFAVTGMLAWRPFFSARAGAIAIGAGVAGFAGLFPRFYAAHSLALVGVERFALSEDDKFVIAMRHYAQELRAKVGPDAHPVIVAGTSESALLAYYGGFRVVGTLYWENLDGLKAAAAIYGTSDLATVKALFARRGVTHLLSCPPGNFAISYSTLAGGAPDRARLQRSFSALLFLAHRFPVWLRPVWLSPPAGVPQPPSVSCFAFAPEQSEEQQRAQIERYQREAATATAKP